MTPRVAYLGDLHIRQPEGALHHEVLGSLASEVEAWEPDLILVGGDLTGWVVPHKATPTERNLLVGFLVRLGALAPLVVVRGNHDFLGDFTFLSHLPSVTYVETGPAFIALDTKAGPVGVLALPWLDRSRFAPGADWAEATQDLWRRTFLAAATEVASLKAEGGHAFALAHAAVVGGVLRDGQPPVPTEDPVIDLSALPDIGLAHGFLGHYHEPHSPAPGWTYGGATFVNEYGEGERGWLAWAGGPEHRAVAQPRRLRLSLGAPLPELRPGDRVKLCAEAPSPAALSAVQREAAKVAAAVQAVTGVEVTTAYEVARTLRLREGAAAVAKATTTEHKLASWAEAQDPRPDTDVLARAVELLRQLEAGP